MSWACVEPCPALHYTSELASQVYELRPPSGTLQLERPSEVGGRGKKNHHPDFWAQRSEFWIQLKNPSTFRDEGIGSTKMLTDVLRTRPAPCRRHTVHSDAHRPSDECEHPSTQSSHNHRPRGRPTSIMTERLGEAAVMYAGGPWRQLTMTQPRQ